MKGWRTQAGELFRTGDYLHAEYAARNASLAARGSRRPRRTPRTRSWSRRARSGNKVTNGSFEEPGAAAQPAAWSGSGTAYDISGTHATDGQAAVGLPGGLLKPASTSSAPIPVTAGQTYQFAAAVNGPVPTVSLTWLTDTGAPISEAIGRHQRFWTPPWMGEPWSCPCDASAAGCREGLVSPVPGAHGSAFDRDEVRE